MALSNSQYDAIMREYGRQQIENHHKLEERRKEIYARLPVVKQLEAEIAERSVCLDADIGRILSALNRKAIS